MKIMNGLVSSLSNTEKRLRIAPTPISEPLQDAGSRSDAILYADEDAKLSHGGAILEI
jgi:hypothetical protein